jgi:undecaprenyl-diphosphatase
VGPLEALVLGVVQGLTEFLPVSSSAHLVIVPAVLGWPAQSVAFDVLLHLGTLAAVLVYYRADLMAIVKALLGRDPALAAERRLGVLLAIGTVVTVAIVLPLQSPVEALFSQVAWVGAFLLVTSLAMLAAESLSRRDQHDVSKMTWWKAALIGVAQGIAAAPGISRSGATMSAGLLLGLDREQAARFSFLLSVPIIIAAAAKKGLDVVQGTGGAMPGLLPSAVGLIASAIAGYAAISVLIAFVRRRSLVPFSVYTAAVGAAVLAVTLVG